MNTDSWDDDPDALWKRPADDRNGRAGPRPAPGADDTTDSDRHDDANVDAPAAAAPPVREPGAPFTIAIVSVQGVIVDQWSAYRSVLVRWPGARTLNVGFSTGPVAGVGGSVDVDATFDDVPFADVVVVPGGLGVQEASRDSRLLRWLQQTAPSARWVLASSTGSVVLAAAGLLAGRPAATFWLAEDLLAQHGSAKVPGRVHVEEDRIVTCAGSASAFESVCTVIEHDLGPAVIERIRAELVEIADERERNRRRRRRSRSPRARLAPRQ